VGRTLGDLSDGKAIMADYTPDGRKHVTPDERLDFLPYPPAATSGPLGWSGLRVEHFRGNPDLDVHLPPLTHHLFLLYQRPPDLFSLRSEDLERQGPPPPGAIIFIPAGSPTWWDWHGPCESSQVQLGPQLLTRVAAEALELNPDRVALPPAYALSHPAIRAPVLALDAELRAGGPGGRLLAESLGNVLAVHLLRHFAAPGPAGAHPGGVLSRHKLRAVVDYIHAHLDAELSLDHLAAVAHMSPYHFARLFKNSTGLPPHQYVIARRVERAKELLRDRERLPLAEVAFEAGFSSQSHFTRHFRRLVGVTPGQFQSSART
jgi:AraC family transcriptional regulator